MTYVALGLLFGMAGLLWVIVIDITRADQHTKRPSPRKRSKPLTEAARWEPKAA